MPRALVQEPACRSVVSINSMKKNSPQADPTVAVSIEAINGPLLTRRSVEYWGRLCQVYEFCTKVSKRKRDEEKKITKEQKKVTPEAIRCIDYPHLHLSVPRPVGPSTASFSLSLRNQSHRHLMPADQSTWLAKIPLSETLDFLRLPRMIMVQRTHTEETF
jgi:hypothetical protein